MLTLSIERLTRKAFAPFGEVVDTDGLTPLPINEGFARRFNDLATIDVTAEGGQINISWFVASTRPAPIAIRLMERHPLGSQLFMPLNRKDWLIVVCTDPHIASTYPGLRCNGIPGRKLCPQLLAPSAACSGRLQSVLRRRPEGRGRQS
ncbi:ureidoglycolate hydrolase [Bradyrhizobium sp. i1.3.1]